MIRWTLVAFALLPVLRAEEGVDPDHLVSLGGCCPEALAEISRLARCPPEERELRAGEVA